MTDGISEGTVEKIIRLRNENLCLRDAVKCARKQLVTLAGEAKLGTSDDQIQAQVLFVIDQALR